ncbi:hypothetical protein H8S90_03375 [Olivibacter sp. SDN3]|uniref:DUF6266 family protein n=1 Tax=Olivibacter sp. SDN3 TaxID=2764720 RepID=UPI001651B0FB|nr:DUF6266 family protein [Olivibacter sp. SDN3]QNL50655.1 hypothetical protein H8S90_03375 [Olivibacter sp. SDN3]
MAIAKNGINGSFSGKVGSVIGYQLGGQHVMRTVGERRKPYTPLELLNQAKMKVVSKFLAPIKPWVKLGFSKAAPAGSKVGAFQMAQSHARKHAVLVDKGGHPYIDPARVLVSKGPRQPPHNCTVVRENNKLIFQWEHLDRQDSNDRLMVLLYEEDMGYFRNYRDIGAKRSTQMDVWEIETLHQAKCPIHVYVMFRDPLFGEVSDSVYCGTV